MVRKGEVSVSPYTCVTFHPNSPSSRSMVAAAGGAPAVITCTPLGTSPRALAGAFARDISTVGAAHSQPTCSERTRSKTRAGSTLGRQMCRPPAAVMIHTNVQPLAWNMGSVHRYVSSTVMWKWTRVSITFIQALR